MQRARLKPLWLMCLALFVACGCAVGPAFAEKRVALVIGNSAYRNVAALDNPRNDARLMAATLQGLGFVLIGNGPQSVPKLYANLACSAATLSPGQQITITKTYDGTGGVSHAVTYAGTVSADLRTISGHWSINATRGEFTMSR